MKRNRVGEQEYNVPTCDMGDKGNLLAIPATWQPSYNLQFRIQLDVLFF